ncbi:MAG TPA: hypothetical protein VEA61_08955 [Allosphingosinicella sp.]|nr:hypothetical protein [Allosphingosinicella sp.]
MPDPITLGHLLMLLAVLVALYALWQASIWLKHRSYVYGTPQYARARDGKRFAIWSLAVALLLYVVGCFTPLADLAIA